MTGLHFTMREIFKPSNLLLQAGLCAVATGLFVHIAPFGTFYDMELWPRTLYWGMIMIVNWSISAVGFQAAAMWAAANGRRPAPIVLAVALAISFPATLCVYLANAVFRPGIAEHVSVLSLFGSVLIITLVLGCICIGVAQRRVAPMAAETALIRLSMNDHYVEVETAKGATLILLRFSDALEELGGADGLQVHRSHWGAKDAVESARRDGSRLYLMLKSGQEIPVSRTYRAAAREAGMI